MADASVVAIVIRVVLAVAVVLALMVLAARLTRKVSGVGGFMDRSQLTLVARQQLGKSTSVAVVRSGTRTLVLGVTETNITLLSEHDTPTEAPNIASPQLLAPHDGPRTARRGGHRPGPPRTNFVEMLRERTIRRS